ncbi:MULTISPECIES: HNH endonuclease signature motif containing protein [Nocardiaceae]|uniref:DUF222 domain-containing protein n=1 Tax=Rhodococcoides kroppenstedtii TaxID=293050 RepID=A0ABS7NP46_9NOCA|nr:MULTISPECIES: HNH endonuclease signature motif containing protein [Rhodococcus]AMY19726.1 hypothetical protein A3Q40_02353 [Rhodococcus sp. PBTS 1]MBY6312159.1 DUF222 domain-containing protein [Rhodococcus kroppenstedtii]MBY6319757.1 DUF222 domain-containing protein [Rhodococcus kroppenstedtii]MBY6398440.1 DUF222 domain-containing protein [Rhodococcus kroppenstedtii]
MVGMQVGTQNTAVPWAALDHTALGLPATTDLPSPQALDALVHAAAGVAYLKWFEYQLAAAMHAELVEPFEDEDRRELDAFTRCAATIATTMSITQGAARTLLTDAVALRDRLPLVAECLRDGVVTPHHIRTIVSRTELVEGQCYAALVDADIARALRRAGSWSPARMEAMVDTMVDRRDPDAVRARREKAKRNREFTVEIGRDGLATATDTRPAEDIVALHASVTRLAAQVCPKDTRSKAARASDAHYALITQTGFGCNCDRPITDCRYKSVDVEKFAANSPRILIHLVTDTTTLTGPVPAPENERVCRSPQHLPRPDLAVDTSASVTTEPSAAEPVASEPAAAETVAPETVAQGTVATEPVASETAAAPSVSPDRVDVSADRDAAASDAAVDHTRGCEEPVGLDFVDGVGFLPGIGIISGAHVRDLAADPHTVIRPLGDGTDTPLPATQPSNPYRPSAALDAYVRARDLFCTWPGCNRPARDGDLDHITEYDHTHPEKGGRTSATGLGAKCRFHHLLKTFADFVDDQYPDPTDPSRLIRTIAIPDGRTVLGPAFTGHDVHPGLDAIVFGDPPDTPTPRRATPGLTERRRPAPRTEQKHARRRQERNRNRFRRVIPPDNTPPPF